MAEDWRVSVTVQDNGRPAPLLRLLHEREVRNELREELGGRVAVSSDGPTIFLYAGTRRAAEAAATELRAALADRGLTGEPRLDRWHPVEERWESAEVPLPGDEAAREVEQERLEETARGERVAEWEVRVELERHADAVALATQLEEEGYLVVRRWRYLLIGTATRGQAEELGRRLAEAAPEGARVRVEPGLGVVWELMPSNPFAVFGGLGS
jgi:hypothetical protein